MPKRGKENDILSAKTRCVRISFHESNDKTTSMVGPYGKDAIEIREFVQIKDAAEFLGTRGDVLKKNMDKEPDGYKLCTQLPQYNLDAPTTNYDVMCEFFYPPLVQARIDANPEWFLIKHHRTGQPFKRQYQASSNFLFKDEAGVISLGSTSRDGYISKKIDTEDFLMHYLVYAAKYNRNLSVDELLIYNPTDSRRQRITKDNCTIDDFLLKDSVERAKEVQGRTLLKNCLFSKKIFYFCQKNYKK